MTRVPAILSPIRRPSASVNTSTSSMIPITKAIMKMSMASRIPIIV